MDSISQLEDLKKVALELSIDIITGSLFDSEIIVKSGHCKVKGKNTIIIDSLLSSQEQSEVIIQALKKFNLESVYLPPWIRERLEPDNSI
jgi:orotate phosphoribosyltransferase-like protein